MCQVCYSGDSEYENKIVFCSDCNMGAHQGLPSVIHHCFCVERAHKIHACCFRVLAECYAIQKIPEGDWFCDACAAKRAGTLPKDATGLCLPVVIVSRNVPVAYFAAPKKHCSEVLLVPGGRRDVQAAEGQKAVGARHLRVLVCRARSAPCFLSQCGVLSQFYLFIFCHANN